MALKAPLDYHRLVCSLTTTLRRTNLEAQRAEGPGFEKKSIFAPKNGLRFGVQGNRQMRGSVAGSA